MQIKMVLIWGISVGVALVMNVFRFEYRHLVFPLLLVVLPFAAAEPKTLVARVALPQRGWREFGGITAAILVFFPPLFFLYHLVWMKASFVVPEGAALLDALRRSLLLTATAALPEEFFFRGWIQETVYVRLGAPAFLFISRKNLLTSFLFGAAHAIAFLNPLSAATFFPSLLFGWITERSDGSIVPSIFLHAVSNLVLFTLLCFIG